MQPDSTPRVLILSHVFPLGNSGQAVALKRVLAGLSDDRCTVVGLDDVSTKDRKRLGKEYQRLAPLPRLPYLEWLPIVSRVLFVLNAMWLTPLRAVQLYRILRIRRPQVVIACSGDAYMIPAAALACRWSGLPLIPYMFDDFVYQWVGVRRMIARLLERISIKPVFTIIAPNEFLADACAERTGCPVSVVRNPADVDVFNEGRRREKMSAGGLRVVYTGSVYHAHYDAFRNLLAALDQMEEIEIRLHLYTSQSPRKLAEHGLAGNALVCHPVVKTEAVPGILQNADILFLPLAFETQIGEVIKTSSPGKLGEYLASGVPVLVHAPSDSFVSWFCRERNCAAVVDSPSVPELVNALRGLVNGQVETAQRVRNARRCAEEEFSLPQVQRKFSELIASAVVQG